MNPSKNPFIFILMIFVLTIWMAVMKHKTLTLVLILAFFGLLTLNAYVQTNKPVTQAPDTKQIIRELTIQKRQSLDLFDDLNEQFKRELTKGNVQKAEQLYQQAKVAVDKAALISEAIDNLNKVISYSNPSKHKIQFTDRTLSKMVYANVNVEQLRGELNECRLNAGIIK